MLIVLIVDFI